MWLRYDYVVSAYYMPNEILASKSFQQISQFEWCVCSLFIFIKRAPIRASHWHYRVCYVCVCVSECTSIACATCQFHVQAIRKRCQWVIHVYYIIGLGEHWYPWGSLYWGVWHFWHGRDERDTDLKIEIIEVVDRSTGRQDFNDLRWLLVGFWLWCGPSAIIGK